jgi:hypothetical protein
MISVDKDGSKYNSTDFGRYSYCRENFKPVTVHRNCYSSKIINTIPQTDQLVLVNNCRQFHICIVRVCGVLFASKIVMNISITFIASGKCNGRFLTFKCN